MVIGTKRAQTDRQTNADATKRIGDLSHLPRDDDLLYLPIEINKGLFIDDEQPIDISIG